MMSPIGFILGSGWDKILKEIKPRKKTSYEKIFGNKTSVPGHQGEVISANIFNKELIFLSGRFHTYEGYSSYEAAKTIGYLHKQGVRKVVITSACGGLNPQYQVGDLVILTDMITLFCQSPLIGPQFQDLSQPFSFGLISKAEKTARQTRFPFQKGIHVYVRGPHYETFSDKKVLRFLGADVVGMSMAPEVIMAKYLKMEVLGLSLVTNLAFVKHSHKEVLKSAQKMENKLYQFIEYWIKSL